MIKDKDKTTTKGTYLAIAIDVTIIHESDKKDNDFKRLVFLVEHNLMRDFHSLVYVS
jgi:hypothetical protein